MYFNIHSGSCAPAEGDLPSLATIFSQALSRGGIENGARDVPKSTGRSQVPKIISSLRIHEYLERLSNLLRAAARQSGKTYRLQPVQLEVLHYLALCNRYSNTPLAITEYLGVTRGTVSQTLIVLHNKGLINKETDHKDKRVVHLRLTVEGKKLVQRAVPAFLLQAGCARLTTKEQSMVIEAMNKLLVACQRTTPIRSFVCSTCRYNQHTADGGYFSGLTQEPLSATDVVLICREHAYVKADGTSR